MSSQTVRTRARLRESLRRLTTGRAPSLALAALFALMLAPAAAAAGRTFAVRPSPAWAKEVAPGADEGVADDDKGGSLFLLDDHQTRVAGGRTERYFRHVKKILSAAGLEEAAEFSLPFEPTYQELFIHHIRIVRGGQVIDALAPREIKVIQQEDELDQRLYNGQLSAVVFLKDVRVGDVIDYAYSVNGDNPVMGGRFADEIHLADAERIQRLHCRLLWPSARPLSLRNRNTDLQPRTSESGGVTEYVWERERVPALEYEDATPAWFSPAPLVQLSEFEGWGAVVRWALPLYEAKNLSPELRRKIEEWRASSPDPERRLLAALRFVQDEVRYLGIELGQYSHRPSQPGLVFARRFGDCKDKSLLLSTALNALGVDARLALVNTEAGRALDSWQPSPYAFDHVIVRATLNGQTYWLDPTVTHQRGTLAAYYPPDFGRALVLGEGTELLEVILPASGDGGAPAAAAATTTVEEVYTVASHESPATHEITTTYRGPDADQMRYTLSQQSLNEIAKRYLNYYAERDPSIKAEGLPQVSDDEETNTVVVRERYSVLNFWTEGRRQLWADRVYMELSKPGVARRTAPLAVPFPKHVRQTIEIRLPEVFDVAPESTTISNDAFSLAYSYARRGKTVRLEFTLRSLDDHVPAERVTKYLEDIGKMQKAVGFELTRGAQAFGFGPSAPALKPAHLVAGAIILLIVPVVILSVVLVLVFERRRRGARAVEWRRQQQQQQPARRTRGSEPERAIPVWSEEDLLGHVREWRSACGRTFYQGSGGGLPQERLSFDGESLVFVRLRCEDCGDAREAYFVRPRARGAESVAAAENVAATS